uniref:Uncharacterized protein n=1 Tax=Arundo donax TaxID=35708 RepID=A0A0A9G7F7_ARUDO
MRTLVLLQLRNTSSRASFLHLRSSGITTRFMARSQC